MTRASTLRLLEVDPDLGLGIHPSERAAARELVVAWRTTLWTGAWDPGSMRTGRSPAFAVMVVDGLLSRERLLAGGGDAEILGPGDVFDPWATEEGLVPTTVRWTVIAPTEVAVLGRRFLVAVRRWPTLAMRLFERAAEQQSRLSVRAAINAIPHAHQRILGTLWHLAGLYGTVRGGEEVVLPMRLTHEAIGRLARARRPTVSRAMKTLTGQRLLEVQADGSLVLREASRALLETPVADLEPGSVNGIHLVGPIRRTAEGRATGSRTLDRLANELTLLRAVEADYRALFELAGIGVALIEPSSGALLRLNERLAALLGSSIETLIGSDFWAHMHSDDRERVRDRVSSLLDRHARPAYLDIRLVSSSGSLAWTRTSFAALHSGDSGDPGADRLIAVVEDISEQRIATEARDAAEHELTAELDAMRELHRRSARVAEASSVAEMLDLVLEGVMALQQGSLGSIQLYDPDTSSLVLAAQRGFSETVAARFRVVAANSVDQDSADPDSVDPGAATPCGRVLASRRPVLVEDVRTDPGSGPYRGWARDAGYRGVYSAPMIGRTGELLGVLSVYFAAPRRPSEREMRVTDLYLRLVVALVERARAEEAAAAELADIELLRDLGARLVGERDLPLLFEEIVAAAIALARADAGTLQLLEGDPPGLVLAAAQGFDASMTRTFARVDAASGTSCGRALTEQRRILVDYEDPAVGDARARDEDLAAGDARSRDEDPAVGDARAHDEDPAAGDARARELHRQAGYLSAQSTPLVTRAGAAIGMLSTHWRTRHRPTERELHLIDLLARQAADLITQVGGLGDLCSS